MYVLTIKQSISVLSICTLLYLLSPAQSIPVSIQAVQAKEVKTTTGVVASGVVTPIQVGGKEDNKKGFSIQGGQISTKEMEGNAEKTVNSEVLIPKMICDATCKVKTLVSLGIAPKIASSLVYECKKQDISVVNCIKLGASIAAAESGGGDRCYKNGCFGILAGGIAYDSVEEGTIDWVKRFGKHWYNQTTPSNFYSNSPDWKPKTHYCMSEKQPDGTKLQYCKNGHKHAWDMFNKISKVF